MSEDIHHECGIAALYWLNKPHSRGGKASASVRKQDVVPLVPTMLLDVQNRGQLAAGISTYNPDRPQILDTFKDVGTVAEAFRMSHPAKYAAILDEYAGAAAIGHTRYALQSARSRARWRPVCGSPARSPARARPQIAASRLSAHCCCAASP